METIDSSCPFCTIVERTDMKVREVWRDEHMVAFFPTEPATLGHTLLIPRRHVPDIWSLPGELAARLGEASVNLASAIKQAFVPEGLNVIQSNGRVATQTVGHLHVHLVPRWTGDPVGPIWPPETNYGERKKDDAWRRLKSVCDAMPPTAEMA